MNVSTFRPDTDNASRWEAEHPRADEELREAEQAFDRAVEQEASEDRKPG